MHGNEKRNCVRAIALCAMVFGLPAWAQDTPPTPGIEAAETTAPAHDYLKTPVETLRTFIVAMFGEDETRALECLDLSEVPADAAADRALELYRCINRLERLEFDDPEWQALPGRLGDRTTWSYFPPETDRFLWPAERARFNDVQAAAPDARIVLTRAPNGDWLFSAETVKGSRAFWESLQSAGINTVAGLGVADKLRVWERFERQWPQAFIENEFIGVKYWQWITLFALIVIGVILDFTVRFLLTVVSQRAIRRRGGEATRETLRKTVRPFGLSAAALFWLWAIRLLGLGDAALVVLVPAVRFFAMLAVVWSAYRVTDLLGEVASSKATGTTTKFDDLLIPLVRKALKIFITVFGLIYIADSFNVPLAPLLTGLGIGGAGFAFAAKDTLEHFFGSITVIVDRPFEVGDWVQIGDVEGTVEELGFRSTRVRTFYNSLVTVPNGNLVRAVVDNYGKRKYRRWSTHLNLTYGTAPDDMEAFCEGVREIIRRHPYTRKDYYQVWLHKFGAHSLDVLLYVFFQAPDWNTELRERHRLMLDIIRLADRLGVEFAFPTQTLHIERPAPGPPERADAPDSDADRRARAIGRRAVRALTANADWRKEKPPPYVFDYAMDEGEDPETQIESTVGGSA